MHPVFRRIALHGGAHRGCRSAWSGSCSRNWQTIWLAGSPSPRRFRRTVESHPDSNGCRYALRSVPLMMAVAGASCSLRVGELIRWHFWREPEAGRSPRRRNPTTPSKLLDELLAQAESRSELEQATGDRADERRGARGQKSETEPGASEQARTEDSGMRAPGSSVTAQRHLSVCRSYPAPS